MITKYDVIQWADDRPKEEFTREVENRLLQGWVLVGGIIHSVGPTGYIVLAQAMTLEVEI